MFDKSTRTLMKMLFERGAVTEISGVCKVRRWQRKWTVVYHPVNDFRDEAYYTGTVAGVYSLEAEGLTLDEALNGLEKILEET